MHRAGCVHMLPLCVNYDPCGLIIFYNQLWIPDLSMLAWARFVRYYSHFFVVSVIVILNYCNCVYDYTVELFVIQDTIQVPKLHA